MSMPEQDDEQHFGDGDGYVYLRRWPTNTHIGHVGAKGECFLDSPENKGQGGGHEAHLPSMYDDGSSVALPRWLSLGWKDTGDSSVEHLSIRSRVRGVRYDDDRIS